MPTTPSIGSSSATNPYGSSEVEFRDPQKTLEQDDFLELLVAQMTNQDPMNPTENMESFAQLAQFSALEQNKAMQANLAVLHANSMLGQEVQVKTDDGESVTGVVSEVQLLEGTPTLIVNGERYDLDKVEIVRSTTTNLNS